MSNNIKPNSLNLQYQDKFQFAIKNFPNTAFFCSEVNIPGISLTSIDVGNPLNRVSYGGNKIQFEELSLTFRVNEDLSNYKEIWNWMINIGAPNNFGQFKKAIQMNVISNPKDDYQIYSDATLFTLKNSSNYGTEIIFKDLFPISLSGLSLSQEGDAPLTATCSFRYLEYEFRRTNINNT